MFVAGASAYDTGCVTGKITNYREELRGIMPSHGERLLYCDHVEEFGKHLFQLACERDFEGIVAKRKFDPYVPDQTNWLKIRNRNS